MSSIQICSNQNIHMLSRGLKLIKPFCSNLRIIRVICLLNIKEPNYYVYMLNKN